MNCSINGCNNRASKYTKSRITDFDSCLNDTSYDLYEYFCNKH